MDKYGDNCYSYSRRDALKASGFPFFCPDPGKTSIKTINRSIGRENYTELSTPQSELDRNDYFDVVIIGSGYGGSILGARISENLRPGKSICILERGKEWQPGSFPETSTEMLSEVSMDGLRRQKLLNLRAFNDFFVLRGIGLGGGSLINANVAIKPEPQIFEKNWPSALNAKILDPYYQKARKTLRVGKGFADSNSTPKLNFLEGIGKHLEGSPGYRGYYRLDNTAFITPENIGKHRGSRQFEVSPGVKVKQAPCIMCGNCMNGCNVGAKNTLATSYLPIARKHGTKMFTGFEAVRIEKDGDFRYRIIGKLYRNGKAQPKTIQARNVIVSAGTLGTNEILLRSDSIPLSPMAGKKFQGNGDSLAMLNDTGKRINGIGYGTECFDSIPRKMSQRSGLAIQGALDLRDLKTDPFMLQDLTLPLGLGQYMNAVTPFAAKKNLMAFLIMSEDTLKGELTLSPSGKLKGDWPFRTPDTLVNLLKEKMAPAAREKLIFLSRGLFDFELVSTRLTAHPLGGACMADSAEKGVVDSQGRVFDYSCGGVHKGMYVADGSVIPSSLIANPFLTISALSEWIAESFIKDCANKELFIG